MALPGGRRLPSNIYQNVTTALQGMFFKFVFFLSLSHFKYPPDKSRSVYSLVCFSDDCETPKKNLCSGAVARGPPPVQVSERQLIIKTLCSSKAAFVVVLSKPYTHFLDISLSRHTSA
jgi:hypothetical protein